MFSIKNLSLLFSGLAFSGNKVNTGRTTSFSIALRLISLCLGRKMASSGVDGEGEKPKHTNRLKDSMSPYLLQHKHNPVDWYPWGDEAFDKAKQENKPIFLSVGYSTCHWCHVMERESFESEEIAQILNEKFVSVKVDREERPDVDKVYMTYIQAMTGGGGWPMSVWLTPDLKPFVGATYFPPEDQAGRPGFRTILNHISKQWEENRDKLTQQANIILEAIQQHTGEMHKQSEAGDMPSTECIGKLFSDMKTSFDEEYGGYGGAPKFPQASNFNFLLRFFSFKSGTEEGKDALNMVLKTLDFMEKGGIHDHIGQGFHRYSTDRFWHVPHFEKMLYDQAQLAVLYGDSYQASRKENLAETTRDILLYVMRDLSHQFGGFYSAEDADSLPSKTDSHKKEGAFCVWEEKEIRHLLREERVTNESGENIPTSCLFLKHYGVESEGNVKPHQDPHRELCGKNVLIVRGSLQETARSFHMDESTVKEQLVRAREILFEERRKRPPPHLDTKMITAWNGLMISGLARGAQVLGEDVYEKRAIKAAEFVRKYLFDEKSGQLLRSCYRGDSGEVMQIDTPIFGFADDYVFMIRGLLDLYEASLDEQWLEWAVKLQAKLDEILWDSEGVGYFMGKPGDPSILVRMKEAQDGAEPSANSSSVGNLVRLSSFTDDKKYLERAEQIIKASVTLLSKLPLALPELVSSYIMYLQPKRQIIIAGDRESEDTKQLLKCVHSHYIPNKVLMLCNGKEESFLASKIAVFKTLVRKNGKATAYVCQNNTCSLPVNTVEALERTLSR
ncbi:spermatogenesis-associated protein 20-like isoform X1 [Montipora capricornis]|uniref:spermatogenesis-associated protein 20-like isoform X1 n=1 Tax=Montipora capricornis TaxID=246305 RepID=UPI0035F1D6AB